MEIVDSSKFLIEPYEKMVDIALLNLRSHLTYSDTFSWQENDEVEKELATNVNDTLDESNLIIVEPSRIFLAGNTGCGKSFLIKLIFKVFI